MVIAAAADDRLAYSCFVIMPYGVRDVGRRRVDFDRIYETIFKPAIRRVRVDGRTMIPVRADEPQQSRVLIHTMLRDLLLARLALADVSTENTNVGWELAHRHVGRPSGTALLALKGTKVPFDVSTVMVARYADTPPASAADSVGTIAGLLRATLRHNEVDSPSYTRSRELVALMGPPGNPTPVGEVMVEGEAAALSGAPQIAAQFYQKATALAPGVPQLYQRQGTLFLESGNQELASLAFRRVLELDPGHDEARRILGDLKRGHRPETIASNPLESLAFKDLVTADHRLDVGRVMAVVGDCPGTSISIVQGPSKRGDCIHSSA